MQWKWKVEYQVQLWKQRQLGMILFHLYINHCSLENSEIFVDNMHRSGEATEMKLHPLWFILCISPMNYWGSEKFAWFGWTVN